MSKKKTALGQFFTIGQTWLRQHVLEFIINSGKTIIYDPYAGGGDLLKTMKEKGFEKSKGLDIDQSLLWEVNDSLVNIPQIEDAIIVTNPPYLAKQSASRKGINHNEYFSNSHYDDLYLIALDKMLDAQDYVVAIIPESFVNSTFKRKDRLVSITILEENPFLDTENPVCVVCFDNHSKPYSVIKIYKEDEFIFNYQKLIDFNRKPSKTISITFNTLSGWLALRAVDSTSNKKLIEFGYPDAFDYDWENNIKISSRHMTIIQVNVPKSDRDAFIEQLNNNIKQLRELSKDVIFTPFMGNRKDGIRRRRLDFKMARRIIEDVFEELYSNTLWRD